MLFKPIQKNLRQDVLVTAELTLVGTPYMETYQVDFFSLTRACAAGVDSPQIFTATGISTDIPRITGLVGTILRLIEARRNKI
jgi:hypothetical protein